MRIGALGLLLALAARAPAPAQCTGCSQPSFAGPRAYSVSQPYYGNTESFAVADGNSDGRLDLIAYDPNAQKFSFFPGGPDGHFGDPITSPAAYNIGSIVVGDFDGDGIPDVLAFVSFGSGTALYHGVGNGTFTGPTVVASLGSGTHPAVGDFDGDGKADVAYFDGYANISINLGEADGTFPRAATIPLGLYAAALSTADLNGDGRTDLVAAVQGDLAVVLGSASGVFAPASLYPAANNPQALALGDFNGDGFPDVAAAGGSTVLLFVGTGGGSLVPSGSVSGSFGQPSVAIGDFTGGGHADLFVGSDLYSVFAGDGAGNFTLARTGLGWGFSRAVAADVNRDGLPDLVLGSPGRGISLVLSAAPAGLDLPRGSAVSVYLNTLAVGDFNGDQIPDVAAWSGSSSIALYFGNAAGDLSAGPTVPYSPTYAPPGIYALDVDADGKADLVLIDADRLVVLRNLGGATFAAPVSIALGFFGGAPVSLADMNGDGRRDLLVLNRNGNSLAVLLASAGGSFLPPRLFAVGNSPVSMTAADFDGDGRMDVAIATSGVPSFAIFRGDGFGGFLTVQTFSLPAAPSAVLAVDVDGDLHPDLVVVGSNSVNYNIGNLYVYRNGGTGTFTSSVSTLPGWGSSSLIALKSADVNGDGFPDIAVGPLAIGSIGILVNDGSGHFSSPRMFAGPGPTAFEFADFDGDGLPDLVFGSIAGYPGLPVATIINTSCRARHLQLSSDVPSCDFPGSPFSPPPVVDAIDDGGNVVTCAAGSVVASLVPGSLPPGAALGGTLTRPLVAGSTTFGDLSVTPAGKIYRIQFDASQGRVRSRDFTAGALSPAITGPASFCALGNATYDAGPGFDLYLWALDGTAIGSSRTVMVGPAVPGSHVLSVVVRFGGCAGSASTTVTANPPPDGFINRASRVCAGSAGNLASVADAGPGATYAWTIGNGTITAGAGTSSITYTAGSSGPVALSVVVTANGCSANGAASVPLNPTCGSFFTIAPCRLVDTRDPIGPLGGPSLAAGAERSFSTRQASCGIPDTARSIAVNVTATQATADGDLRLFPGNSGGPLTSTVNYRAGRTRANNAIVGLDPLGVFSVICSQSGGTVDLIVDVTGYFE